ncbi:MAG: hypothetical protein JEZ06_11930 [Anaerolineaceae bacterium]|nr:hypothetical protein [Anaerolineaceae bacterium]
MKNKCSFYFHRNTRFILIGLLLLMVIPLGQTVLAQGEEEVLLYHEDFESDDLVEWNMEFGWDVIQQGDNHVLSGKGHVWAGPDVPFWQDYRFRFRVNLADGAELHANFRMSGVTRYFIGLNQERTYLAKQTGSKTFINDLGLGVGLSTGWQWVEISGYGPTITVSINDQEVITYTDPEPILKGAIAFESLSDSQVMVDDIELWGIGKAEKEVIVDESGLTWVRTGGPLGGLGYDVRIHPDNPDIMYVTDAWAGVHISTDGGQNWFPSNEGITTRKGDSADSIPVFCLTIDPHNPDILWVGTEHGSRIFKSVDGGYLWEDMTHNIHDDFRDGLTFRGFTVHPQTSDIVFTAAELHSWANGREGKNGLEFEMVEGIVYKTMDGGQTWEESWRGDNLARYIWINPQNPDVIYISTGIFDREAANSDPQSKKPGGEGVLKSVDGGETWENVNQGLNNLYVGSLFMQPDNPDTLIAGTGNNQYHLNGGVYLTMDGGKTWKHTLKGDVIEAVEFSEFDPQIAYAGSSNAVYRSEDGAQTWHQVSSDEWGPPGVRVGFPIDFEIDRLNPDRIFVNAYGGGNFLSEDGGKTWIASSKGYTGAQVRDIAVHPESPGIVYAAARSGLFISYNGGEDWTGISSPPAKVMEWNAVAINQIDTQKLSAANNWNSDLLLSSDSGETWTLTGTSLEGTRSGWSVITFAPSNPEIVYAGTAGFYSAGSFSPEMPGVGIYISTNSGKDWQPINTVLTQDAHIRDIAVNDEDAGKVYAATLNKGLLFTSNSGSSWELIQNGLPVQGSFSIAIAPGEPNFLLAGFLHNGVYKSTDGGASWELSSNGMPPEATVTSIVFDPNNTMHIFAGDITSGVYQSQDSGQTWRVINSGLQNRSINALAISHDGAHLYAATEGEGVFRLDLNGSPPETIILQEPELADPTKSPEKSSEPVLIEAEEQPIMTEENPPVEKTSKLPAVCRGAAALPLGLASLLFFAQKRKGRFFHE